MKVFYLCDKWKKTPSELEDMTIMEIDEAMAFYRIRGKQQDEAIKEASK